MIMIIVGEVVVVVAPSVVLGVSRSPQRTETIPHLLLGYQWYCCHDRWHFGIIICGCSRLFLLPLGG